MLHRVDHPLDQIGSPPLVPDDQAIDFTHLFRMTLGDVRLQREVLELFCRQTDMLIGRMNAAEPAAVGALAHTLKGSARGIGAWAVAAAAENVETACRSACDVGGALADLTAAAERARTAIAERLAAV